MRLDSHGLHHHVQRYVRCHVQCTGTMEAMAAIREQDLAAGKAALHQWAQAAQTALAALGPHTPDDAPGSTALSSSISAADSLSNRPGQAVIDATIPTAQAEHQTTQETTVSATPTVPTEDQPTQIDAAKRLFLSLTSRAQSGRWPCATRCSCSNARRPARASRCAWLRGPPSRSSMDRLRTRTISRRPTSSNSTRTYGCAWPAASPAGARRRMPATSAPSASATISAPCCRW